MFKKVMSIGFVAFLGFSSAANVCSASNKDVNVPGKWTNFVPTSIKDGNVPAKWMGFVPTWISDECSTCDGSATDCNDDGEYSNYYDSTTDSYYDENCDGSTTDSYYDSSNEDSDYDDNNDGEYIPDKEKEKEEQLDEDEDLEDMKTMAVWERRKKWLC